MQFQKRPAVFQVNEIGGGKHAFVIHHHPGLALLHARIAGFRLGVIGAFLGFFVGLVLAADAGNANPVIVLTIVGAMAAGGFGYLFAMFVVKSSVRRVNKIVFTNEGFRVLGRAMRWQDISNFYVKSPDGQMFVGKNAYDLKAKVELYNRLVHFEWKVCVDFGHDTVVVFKRLTEIQAYEIAEALNDLRTQNMQAAA